MRMKKPWLLLNIPSVVCLVFLCMQCLFIPGPMTLPSPDSDSDSGDDVSRAQPLVFRKLLSEGVKKEAAHTPEFEIRMPDQEVNKAQEGVKKPRDTEVKTPRTGGELPGITEVKMPEEDPTMPLNSTLNKYGGEKRVEGGRENVGESEESNDEAVEEQVKAGQEIAAENELAAQVLEEFRKATDEIESQAVEELRDGQDSHAQEEDPASTSSSEGNGSEGDEDYDIMQELAEFPSKFRETAGRVAEHLRPDVLKWTGTSKEYFEIANQQITESFSPLIGKQYAPFVATMVSYAVLLLPLIVAILLFERIKALFSLPKLILFADIYLTSYFATLCMACVVLGLEPMSFFFHNTLSSYISLQILQALGYAVYLLLQGANVVCSFTFEKAVVAKLIAVAQWAVAVAVGLHYYVTVFHPAIAIKPPRTSWRSYAAYTLSFFMLCLFGRLKASMRQYTNSRSGHANKKS